MSTPFLPATGRKDLQDLVDLPRSPVLSYLQKQAEPDAPRPPAAKLAVPPVTFPNIAMFSPLHWWNFVRSYMRHRFGPRHRFLSYQPGAADNGVYGMPDDSDVRIALAGDWGTGTDEAAAIAKLIVGFDPHYSIHLGDVYYVGDPAEVGENFLGIANPKNRFEPCLWPKGSRGAFALNGNHEMYSRGYSYFSRMLPALGPVVDGRSRGQGASFFCLENKYWRIIAVDTGYNSIGLPLMEYISPPDCSLRPELLDWLRATVKPRGDDPRGIIVLSHHQYFSRFQEWYPKPARQLAEFFSRKFLWFWGHEHRVAIYREFGAEGGPTVYGRCVGHGGMPVDLPPLQPLHPECGVEFVDERHYPNDENLLIGFNGFARLTLQQERLKADYVDVHGAVLFSETWTMEGGALRRIAGGAAPA